RTFDVAEGTADADLKLAANLVDGSVIKTGPGLLELGGWQNTFDQFELLQGTLRLPPPEEPDIPLRSDAVGIYTFDDVVGQTVINEGMLGASKNGTLADGAWTYCNPGVRGDAMSIWDW
ncbi:hypothetical protein RZS08_27065, partial [Arthrospira platensis SPKY1]|nr:hypothetical protein [Arthrospira platensis SPKY1]